MQEAARPPTSVVGGRPGRTRDPGLRDACSRRDDHARVPAPASKRRDDVGQRDVASPLRLDAQSSAPPPADARGVTKSPVARRVASRA